MSALALTARSAEPPPVSSAVVPPPAEETRLNAVQFREALKKRGLNEILELHLKDFPPTNATTTLLLMREVKLAEFADTSRPAQERQSSIAEANRILRQLVEDNPEDARRFQWQYTLGHSLLYEEAEPFITNILYFGGGEDDRARLKVLASRAVETIQSLVHRIQDESARIDRLPTEEFEALEQRGYVDELDRLALSADYLLHWALFYDALPRDDDGSTRARELSEIVDAFAVNPSILQVPHERSHIQVPARLLAGMTQRRLNDHAAAREHLGQVLALAKRLADVVERERLRWAVTLARIELIRNDRDDGRFDDALAAAVSLRGDAESGGEVDFGLRLASTMLMKSIYEAQAAVAEKADRSLEASELRTAAWKALAQLAGEKPDRRDAIYAALYRAMGRSVAVERLDPFEQCAYVAGLISESGASSEASATLLQQAIDAGERFLLESSGEAKSLTPEMLYQLAVAQYRKGDRRAAATRFIEAAGYEPGYDRALVCATLAVQLAAELFHDERNRPQDETTTLYRRSLELLLANHSATEAGRYWRFYYAQLLDEVGEFDAAAGQYRMVDAAHEHYVESGFLVVRALAEGLNRAAAGGAVEMLDLRLRADGLLSAYRDFMARGGDAFLQDSQSPDRTSASRLLAEARLLTAEAEIIPRIDRSAQAIELLSNFEQDYPQESFLYGRVWRVRLLAYEALGRLDDATRAIPAYLATAPDEAQPILQGLFTAISADVERLRREGNGVSARSRAEFALVLAEQLSSLAATYDETTSSADKLASKVQLAEANLQAERYERAREMFDEFVAAQDPAVLPTNETDLRVLFGQAEALLRLGHTVDALPKFNRLATGLIPTHPIRWRSLLRDLECRTALAEPPAGIVKVIEQQKYLFPDLGGAALAAEFERVRRENERRLESE